MIRCPVCLMPSHPPLSFAAPLAKCACYGGPKEPHFHVFCRFDGEHTVTKMAMTTLSDQVTT